MNDREATEIVGKCMTDETPLTVNIMIKDAWLLVSAIQLATRHPELSVWMKDSLFNSAEKFQVAVENLHPEAHELIEMGWDKRYDGLDSIDDFDADEADVMSDWDDDDDESFDEYDGFDEY